jgi:drug efflux transport system permease protein
MNGFWAVLRKELIQMKRDKGTLRLALIIPVLELILFGMIDMNVRHVPTEIFDQSRTEQSRRLVAELVATSLFDIVGQAPSHHALWQDIVAGRAQVGIEIPPDYARRRLNGEPATFLALIDGSDSTVSSQALAAVNGLALSQSLDELSQKYGLKGLPISASPLLLFNPDGRSAELLIPGLIAVLLTFSGTVLAAFSIVRERERGTLEQLMVTPVSPAGVVLGKLLPYLLLGFAQLLLVLLLMVVAFRVPIHGNVLLLLGLSLIYLFALLAMGLLVSVRARTQIEAMQGAQSFLLPAFLLSGYIFPIASLPLFLQVISIAIPATHFIAISRGIIIRGAGFVDLWPHIAVLLAISILLVALSTRAFRKTVA